MKILMFLFLSSLTWGQYIKIGDISVTPSLAKEYFLWCCEHPDTTWFFDYSVSKSDSIKHEKEMAKKLKKAKTEEDSMIIRFNNSSVRGRWLNGEETRLSQHNIGTVTKKEKISDDLTYYYYGYLTKRNPTALDFSRWYIK